MPDTSNKIATQATQVLKKCNTSETRVQHECDKNNTSAVRLLDKQHDCDRSEKI